jgi:hypothetical protein
MKSARACLLIAMAVLASGCPDSNGPVTSSINRWSFTMGNRGGGIVSFIAIGLQNGEQRGECREPVCRTTVDNLTFIQLSPIANNGFTFKRWDGDPANGLFCAGEAQDAAGTILVKITQNAACFAIFEAVTGTPSTPPGAR